MSSTSHANNGGNSGKGKGRAVSMDGGRLAEIRRQKAELAALIASSQLQLAQLADEEREADNDDDDEDEAGHDAGNEGGDEEEDDDRMEGSSRVEASSAGRKRPAPDSKRSPGPEGKRARRTVKAIPDAENPWKAKREWFF